MLRATPVQKAVIAASPAVRWMGYDQPAWRVPTAAAGRPGFLENAAPLATVRLSPQSKPPEPSCPGLAHRLSGSVVPTHPA